MRKRTLGVALLAGLAFSGASAFTASNDVTALEQTNANTAGYGAATVTGATVLSVDYVQDTGDGSRIDSVKFVADGDLIGKEATIRLIGTSTSNHTCDTGVASSGVTVLGQALGAGDTVFTCSTPDKPIADFTSIGITVNN